ncbi:MAG: SCP2 sterol-binding domain-containing protein, partial [Gammaproteobacteria bacterium]|nr:SCP2 sterol-binding domain-containing protein [Gammaproteobacteria bacterium]
MQPLTFFITPALRRVPDSLLATLGATLFNHLMRGQTLGDKLAPLRGRRLCLVIADAGCELALRIEGPRLIPDAGARQNRACDVRISGTLADFLLLATRAEDPDTLFFNRRLCLEGDTEAGLYVKNLLDALDYDWPAHLNAVLGPRPAALVLSALRRTGMDQRLEVLQPRLRRWLQD